MKIIKTILALTTAVYLFNSASAQRFTPDIDAKAHALLDSMTLEEKLSLIRGVDLMYTRDIPRLGVSRMRMADGPQGVRGYGLSTAYPSAVMLTATWNEDLARRYGDALGSDCRARGVNFILGPGVNIYRSPLNGRNFEYMGEDPFLASRTAVNYIKGVQNHGVIATVKHFFGNNSEYDRNFTSSDIDERTMHEIYFPVFKAAVQEAEVGAVMSSYNPVNGVWSAESKGLLTDILRDKWGFKGIMMSDWDAVHHSIPAFTAGLDLEMPGSDHWKPETLAYYIKTGHIDTDMLDRKVLHILRTYLAFDADKNFVADTTIQLNDPHSVQVALDVAREGIVLLKNEKNILPINTNRVKKIAVVGNTAISVPCGGGSGAVEPFYRVTPLEAIKKVADENGIEVSYVSTLDVMPQIMFTDETKSTPGLTAQFFDNENLEGTPVATRIDKKILYLWLDGPGVKGIGKEHYSVRWSGKLIPDESCEYEFSVGGDDGYRLYIDGQQVVGKWASKDFKTTTYNVTLEAGRIYDIMFEISQKTSAGGALLTWQPVGSKNDPLTRRLNSADLVIACVGHNAATESESFDRPITLPDEDDTLMKRVAATSTPVVTVVNSGGNVLLPDCNNNKALLWAWFPGQE
ncbi:MAG: glycoside hydrolase family 3 C-terminal domain-containing protein, partial [Muribaculum sp.]|nr:glycoside hydrolase family 3 C-terminal domain-containing protein [Muribaculum sp.]